MTHLCISITQLDCNISFQFIFKSDSMNSRYSFDYCRLSMGYMTNCTYVVKADVLSINHCLILCNVPL